LMTASDGIISLALDGWPIVFWAGALIASSASVIPGADNIATAVARISVVRRIFKFSLL
jgi:hypothetical protein